MRTTRNQILRIPMLLAAIAVLTAATLVSAQITPSADTYTNTIDATTNFGTSAVVNVVSGSQTGYIMFNLSMIPPGYNGSTIAMATLKLYANSVTSAGTMDVDLVTSAWSEKKITANDQPTLGTNIASGVPLTTANTNDYILVDVTPALVDWLNGAQTNFGLALVPNGGLSASFDSKESTATSHPAELDMVFVDGGTITGIATASGSGLIGGGAMGTLPLSLTNTCAQSQVLERIGGSWDCTNTSTGTITGVTAGTNLKGGGTSGKVTLHVGPAVPLLNVENTFLSPQTFEGNMILTNSADTLVFSPEVMLGSYPSGQNNLFVGGSANASTTGSNLVAVGGGSLGNVGSYATGDTAVGANSLVTLGADGTTTGNYDTAIGFFAGQTLDGSAMTGTNNTFLGAGSALTNGSLSNATAVGSNAVVGESNALVLGCVANTNGCAQSVNVGINGSDPIAALDVGLGGMIVRGSADFAQATDMAYFYLGDQNHFLRAVNSLSLDVVTFNSKLGFRITDNSGYVGIGDQFPGSIFSVCQGCGKAIADGWNTYSSRRWKTNIQTLQNALDKVNSLRGVAYDLKGTGKHEVGVVAEEVGTVVPEVVNWEDNGKDARSVDYSRLTALLIEATKERQALIEQQQQQIKAQQAHIKAVHAAAKVEQARINRLATQVSTMETVLATSDRATPHSYSAVSQLEMALRNR